MVQMKGIKELNILCIVVFFQFIIKESFKVGCKRKMKSIKQNVYFIVSCILMIGILGISIFAKSLSLTSSYRKFSATNDTVRSAFLSECTDIGSHKDQCGFVRSNCDGFNSIYLELYYCSNLWKPILIAILLSCLLLLFGAISVVASDFFCPNLQTISSKLQLSESMAGVTILAFGNGSPDLFSTFSALDSNAGSLAIGELIGAAFFIVAIVSGCMGIIRPFQSQKITFMRDASFLTGAIMIISWIMYHQCIKWEYSLVLIFYYFTYVLVVAYGSYSSKNNSSIVTDTTTTQKVEQTTAAKLNIDESTHLLYNGGVDEPLRLSTSNKNLSEQSVIDYNVEDHLGHVIRPTSPNSTRASMHFETIPRSTSTTGSISSKAYRRPMTPRIGFRTSLFGAIEFQEQVNSICRENSLPSLMSINKRHRQNSMPPPMWQMSQGSHQLQSYYVNNHHPQQQALSYLQPNENIGRVGLRRQRACTMADRLLTRSPNSGLSHAIAFSDRSAAPPNTSEAQDYFTYLATHQQGNRLGYVRPPLSPPAVVVTQSQAPEMNIPEIRLAPPNTDDRIPSPEYINVQLNCNLQDRVSRTRGNSTLSLAPPSLLSENDDSMFVSARQSFELSPSNSFDHQNQLLSAVTQHEGLPEHNQQNADCAPTLESINSPPQLNISIDQLLSLSANNISQRCRSNSECSFDCKSSYLPPVSRWHIVLDGVYQVLLPTLQGWTEKSLFSKLSAIAAAPLVLVFTLTLPVAEVKQIKIDDVQVTSNMMSRSNTEIINTTNGGSNTISASNYLSVPVSENNLSAVGKVMVDELDTQQGWNKYLLVAQCTISTTFIFSVFAVNEVIPFTMLILGLLLGTLMSLFVINNTKTNEPPSWFWMFSFVGFFVALNWIFLLANEVVGLLQALGEIFSISEAIMGLTVFALGNSIGDFVANTAIAKMGFPTMAISACYAGPLLNMVLGVGISSFYQIWKTGQPYKLDIAPTIFVSSIGLITVLVSTLVVVNINGYHVTKKLGWWMIIVYMACCTINFMLEFQIIVI